MMTIEGKQEEHALRLNRIPLNARELVRVGRDRDRVLAVLKKEDGKENDKVGTQHQPEMRLLPQARVHVLVGLGQRFLARRDDPSPSYTALCLPLLLP